MKTHFKKALSMVLAILMLLSAVPAQVFAATVENPWVMQTIYDYTPYL